MKILLQERWLVTIAPRSRIDYVLVRPADPWCVVEVTIVDDRVTSDHRPRAGRS